MSSVIEADLGRSGLIKTVNSNGLPRSAELAAVPFADLKARGADAAVIGPVQPTGNGQYSVSFRLVDALSVAVDRPGVCGRQQGLRPPTASPISSMSS